MASFGSRRKAKVIAQDDSPEAGDQDTGPIVKRPLRPKPRTSRISFGPSGGEDEEESVNVIKPKRGLGRKSGLASSTTADQLPVRHAEDEGRPSYSKESLAELKNAQQALPPTENQEHASPGRNLDVAIKFGTTLAAYEKRDASSLIPTDAEIQEKKARRARMAKLAKYNIQSDDSDEASGDERHERRDSDEDEFLTHRDKIALRDERATRTKEPDTRLVRDDEDLMEGFEAFTGEDSRVALGQGAEQEAQQKQRVHIQEMLDAAQQESDSEADGDDDDDHELRNDYKATQTRRGMEGLRMDAENDLTRDDQGARTPPRITPIPTLSSCVERLRGKLLEMEADRDAKLRRMEELEAERKDIAQREVDIQKLLVETAQKYQELSQEAGLSIQLPAGETLNGLLGDASTMETA